MFLSVRGGVDRPYIQNVSVARVSESLVDKRQNPQNRKRNSQHGDWFHLCVAPISGGLQVEPAPVSGGLQVERSLPSLVAMIGAIPSPYLG